MPLTKISSKYPKDKFFTYGIPLFILLIGLTLSYKYWSVNKQANKQKILSSFVHNADTITKNIELRLNTYQLILKGVQSFFYSSDNISRDEFKKYVYRLELEKHYPGIQGLGFALLVSHKNKKDHLAFVRSEGFPQYKIHPASENAFYTPIIYMEPLRGKNLKVLGLNIHNIPQIKESLIRARDTGELTFTKKLTLVQDANSKQKNNAAFVMLLPVYKNNVPHNTLIEKQKNILGWIDAPFRMSDFIASILEQTPKNIDIEIFYGNDNFSKETMLFDSDNTFFNKKDLSQKKTFLESRKIRINNNVWTLNFNLIVEKKYQQLPQLLFAILLSFLTALLILSLTTRHARATQLANKLTAKFKESEILFRTYIENSSIPMATLALTGKWIMTNYALCNALGYSRDELRMKTWKELTHPDDLNLEFGLIKKMLNKEIEKYSIKKRYIHRNGSIFHTKISVQIVYNENNSPDYFAILAQDITQEHHAEQELKEAENRFKDMVNTIDGVVWEADADSFKLTYVNEQIKHLTGYTSEEWKQTNSWISNVYSDDRERVFTHSIANKQSRQNHDIEYRFITKSGKLIWIRDLVTVVHENGKPKWLRGIMVDISHQKENETHQKQLETQLRQSQKMEALGTLSGGVAHDFNNMLGIMLGNAELININLNNTKPFDVKKVSKYLASLRTAGGRATALIAQILTFSRMTPETQKPINLSKVVNDVITMLRETIATSINIELNIDQTAPYVMANENQLHQIVINLVNNAVHAIEQNNGTISICVKQKTDTFSQSRYVCLCVTDDGKGIDKKDLLKIFDPFFTTKEVGEGTGLGLSVIHGIVESHNAEIKVKSIKGEGSTFSIHFPILENKKTERLEVITSPVNTTGKGCILLVEDEIQLQSLYQEFLESLGYKVVCADNGAIALSYLSKNPTLVKLLLTDLVMPELTGKQLCKEVRKLDSQLPIILMTGYNEELSNEDKEKLGISHYLLKPVELSTLSHIIADII